MRALPWQITKSQPDNDPSTPCHQSSTFTWTESLVATRLALSALRALLAYYLNTGSQAIMRTEIGESGGWRRDFLLVQFGAVWEGVGMKVLQMGRFDIQFLHNLPNKKA